MCRASLLRVAIEMHSASLQITGYSKILRVKYDRIAILVCLPTRSIPDNL